MSQTLSIDEQTVADYLRQHPDFFQHNLYLLPALNLPHEAGGAVSLIERQVALLRQQSESQRAQLEDLLEIARENDRLNQQLHQLTLHLMGCAGLAPLLTLVAERMRRDYDADVVGLHLLQPPQDASLAEHPAFAVVAADLRGGFGQLLDSGRPFCGRLQAPQCELLFGADCPLDGSAAVLPLLCDGQVGLLAIGSADAQRFRPGGDTTFLVRMAQVIACALHGHLQPA